MVTILTRVLSIQRSVISLTFFYQPIKDKSKSKNTIDNDPNNPFPKFERLATSVVYTKEDTLPFTLENLTVMGPT
jgi:hypothetical protein